MHVYFYYFADFLFKMWIWINILHDICTIVILLIVMHRDKF